MCFSVLTFSLYNTSPDDVTSFTTSRRTFEKGEDILSALLSRKMALFTNKTIMQLQK